MDSLINEQLDKVLSNKNVASFMVNVDHRFQEKTQYVKLFLKIQYDHDIPK